MNLEAIKARHQAVERLDAHEGGVDTGAGRAAVYQSAEDVPALLAEVERLRAAINVAAADFKGIRDAALDGAEDAQGLGVRAVEALDALVLAGVWPPPGHGWGEHSPPPSSHATPT